MLEEQWVPINDYPNYEVSNYGRIANIYRVDELKPHADKFGTLRVTLYNNGVRKNVQVSRIVLEGFFLNYTSDSQVHYKNGDKSDCSVLNLTLGVVDHIEEMAAKLAELPPGSTTSFVDITEGQLVQVILRARAIRKSRGID